MSISSVKTGAIGDSLLAGNAFFQPTSFESIATATGTGSSSSLTFSSIPSTYKHLQIRLLTRANSGSGNNAVVGLQFNSDTSASYTRHQLRGDGSSTSAFGNTGNTNAFVTSGSAGVGALANAMGVSIIDIQDYASTTANKTVRSFTGMDLNSVDGQILLTSSLWINTAAINAITVLHPSGQNFTTSTVASLYGIKGA
jgi:hypothetical protein